MDPPLSELCIVNDGFSITGMGTFVSPQHNIMCEDFTLVILCVYVSGSVIMPAATMAWHFEDNVLCGFLLKTPNSKVLVLLYLL